MDEPFCVFPPLYSDVVECPTDAIPVYFGATGDRAARGLDVDRGWLPA
jgi:hypothetical protein